MKGSQSTSRFDLLGPKLDSKVVDEHRLAIADIYLPWPHSRYYLAFTHGVDAAPNFRSEHDKFVVDGDTVKLKDTKVATARVEDLRRLDWGKPVKSLWFFDKCYVAASFDKMSEGEFWRHVADSLCGKAVIKKDSIELQVDYSSLRRRWAAMELATATEDRLSLLGRGCYVRYDLINSLPDQTLRQLVEPKATSLTLEPNAVAGMAPELTAYVEARMRVLRSQVAQGDYGAKELLGLIKGTTPTIFLRSNDFTIVIGLPGPDKGFVMI